MMTKEKVLELKRLNNEDGKTIKELSEHFGISIPNVSYWKKRLRNAGHELVINKSRGHNKGIQL